MNETIQENKLSLFTDTLIPTALSFSKEQKTIAAETLKHFDFPTTRNEAWKYTRTGRIASIKGKLNPPIVTVLPEAFNIDANAFTFVFENGIFSKSLSSKEIPAGVVIKNLVECTTEELGNIGKLVRLEGEVFHALNTNYAQDGIYISISDKTIVSKNIQLIHIISGENSVSSIRNYIQCGKFSEANFILGSFSKEANTSFTNSVTEIIVGENAKITIDKIQYEEEGNFTVSSDCVAQDKDSTFSINTLTLNGTFVRNNLTIEVNGTNCITNLNSAYILKDSQHVDNHTTVDHKAPHCESHELYKGVIDDKATAVFNGKVFVRKDSQKINAFQSNGNVLLSDSASINSKPELEIYADDVKCSHGSTTGQLDEEAIFYLRARGISEKSAKHLMVSAFIGAVLDKIENESVLEFAHKALKERFGWEF